LATLKLVEHRSIDYVPIAERHGKVSDLWPMWFSGEAHLATVATGAVGTALGGNFIWMTIAVILGCALGTFFMAVHSTQGPKLGLPQMIQSRPQFGYLGALLIWVVALVAYIGYNAFNQAMAAQTIHTLFGGNEPATMVVFAVFAACIAIAGYDVIHIAQRWVAYVMIVALLVFSVAELFLLHMSRDQLAFGAFKLVPFLAQLFAAAAYQLSWSIYVSDYSRYLPSDVSVRESFWWTAIGAFIGGVWTMLVGTLAASVFPAVDLSEAIRAAGDAITPGFGAALLAASLAGLVTITSLNFYGASLTLLSVIDSIKQFKPTVGKRIAALVFCLGCTLILSLVMSKNLIDRFGEFLAVLLYLFTPWTAINLVDFYIVRKGRYSVREIFNPNGMYGRWNWRGLSAYFVGFVAMIPFFSTEMYTGSVARALGGADVAMLVGLPVASLIYLALCRSLDLKGDRERARLADIGLDPDLTHRVDDDLP
jgi:NCS1 family nucleobase:cation symporter-1